MAYGSELERIASEAAGASSARSSDTAALVRKLFRQTRMGSPIRRSRGTTGKTPRRMAPPVGPSGNFKGPFIKEVHDPLKSSNITSPYGSRIHPITGERSFHTGIDLSAPAGTPVRASASGRVRRAKYVDAYGKQILIGHGGRKKTEYSHLSRIIVKPGQRVRRGQVIGYVGSTGWATGPHLHWTIYRGGKTINPRRFLRGR